jgi:hypothetical protein
MAFDAPGRGDSLYRNTYFADRVKIITSYRAEGSVVSMVGTQVARKVYMLKVKPNMAGIFPNHGIFEIAEALGGMKEVKAK